MRKNMVLYLVLILWLVSFNTFSIDRDAVFAEVDFYKGITNLGKISPMQDHHGFKLQVGRIMANICSLPGKNGEPLLPPETRCDKVELNNGILNIYLTLPDELAPGQIDPVMLMTLDSIFLEAYGVRGLINGTAFWGRQNEGDEYLALEKLIHEEPVPVMPDVIEMPSQSLISVSPQDSSSELMGRLSGPIRQARRQPPGALSGIIVYCSGGHGWTADNDDTYPTDSDYGWFTQRPLLYDMVEDYGNIDVLNFFVNYCFNAGATVVPMRPVGFQPNEIILDNDDAEVSWTGTWTDSTSSIYFGAPGDVAYRLTDTSVTGETARASYTPAIPQSGYYPVYAWTLDGVDRAADQLYRIVHTGGATEVRLNHRRVGKGWVWLGTYYFQAGTGGYVEISNDSSEPGKKVVADAIRFGAGVGDVDRGAGVSGFYRNEECSRYWVQRAIGQGSPSSIYDLAGYRDMSDNVGTPPRMAAHMNREAEGGIYERVYLGYHTNAGGGRGAMALVHSTSPAPSQADYAQYMNDEVEYDMEALDQGVEFPDDWIDASTDVYSGQYGEIYNGSLNGEMSGTIIELAFHDDVNDTAMLRDPRCRNIMARACYQAIVRFLNDKTGGQVPLVFLPDPPTHLIARNIGGGTVELSWHAPIVYAAGGDAATGYVIYISTNGYGFSYHSSVSGGATTSAQISGLTVGEVYYFQVAATDAGGESLPSETMAVRVADWNSRVLIVQGFDRFDRGMDPYEYAAENIGSTSGPGGWFSRIRPLEMNSFDYVIEHARALAQYGVDFDSCANEAVINGEVNLPDYGLVLWISGEEASYEKTFNATERLRISAYLNSGGRLFVSGAEIARDLDSDSNQSDPESLFLNNYLKADYVDDDPYTADTPINTVDGVGGSIFNGLTNITFDDGTHGTYNVDYPDVINPLGGATVAMTYVGSSEANVNAAIQYDGIDFKLLYLGFPFETIYPESSRFLVMERAIDLLLPTPTPTPAPTCVTIPVATWEFQPPPEAWSYRTAAPPPDIPGWSHATSAMVTGPLSAIGLTATAGETTDYYASWDNYSGDPDTPTIAWVDNSVWQAIYTMSTSKSDANTVPSIRLRFGLQHMKATSYIQLNPGGWVPLAQLGVSNTEYKLYLRPPITDNGFFLAFDLIDFGQPYGVPCDGTVYLEEVIVERFDLTDPCFDDYWHEVKSYSGTGLHSWTHSSAGVAYLTDVDSYTSTTEGLEQATTMAQTRTFGAWTSPSDEVDLIGDQFYRAVWTLASEDSTSGGAERIRMHTNDFRYSSYMVVDRDIDPAYSALPPSASGGKDYYLYAEFPGTPTVDKLLLAWDLFEFDPTAGGWAKLTNAVVSRRDLP